MILLPLSLWNRTKMSAGRYVEVMWPKWISPLAYIRAVVTMIFELVPSLMNLHYRHYTIVFIEILKCSGLARRFFHEKVRIETKYMMSRTIPAMISVNPNRVKPFGFHASLL